MKNFKSILPALSLAMVANSGLSAAMAPAQMQAATKKKLVATLCSKFSYTAKFLKYFDKGILRTILTK